MSEATNADQINYWNAVAGETWAGFQEQLDRQLDPLGRAAMSALGPASGEHILDIGCGAGQTSLELAAAVGAAGSVMAVDISHPMLEVARRRTPPAGAGRCEFVEADVQTSDLGKGRFDGAFSRFGVMFFSDPPAAFANVRSAMKSGGRLAFVCWRPPAESPIMTLPMAAAAPHLPQQPPPPQSPTPPPGPFAFADPERVRSILGQAGFSDIRIEPYDEMVGSGDVERSMALSLRVGPLGALLREHPDRREAVIAAVRKALSEHEGPDGVKLKAAVWIVSARA